MGFSTEPYLIEIGDDVIIASATTFITYDGAISCFIDEFPDDVIGKIKIGNKVFIDNNCNILLTPLFGIIQ